MVTAEQVYSLLPAVKNNTVLTVKSQSTNDIIKQVLEQHQYNLKDAKKIAYLFDAGNAYGTCKNVWNFLKYQIPYKIEPSEKQTTKTLSRIVYDAIYNSDKSNYSNDCKHYAGFTGAILESLGYKFKYRFAGYSNLNKYPTHVYCVCNDEKPNIIIDAVLNGFDIEKPYKIKIDKEMSLYKLSGLDQIGYNPKTGEATTEENLVAVGLNSIGITVSPQAVANVAKVFDKGKEAVSNFVNWLKGDRKNTEKVKGGVIWFWKYTPNGKDFGKPLQNEDCTIGYFDQYQKDIAKQGITNYPAFEQMFVAWYPTLVEAVKKGQIPKGKEDAFYYDQIMKWEAIRLNAIEQAKAKGITPTNAYNLPAEQTKTAGMSKTLMLIIGGLVIGGLIYKGGKK